MKKSTSLPHIKQQGDESDDGTEGFLISRRKLNNDDHNDNDDPLGGRVSCMTLHSHRRHNNNNSNSHKRAGEQISVQQYGQWRQEQKTRAAMLEQQLKARWTLEDMIDEQLKRYDVHYNQAMVPTRLEDIAHLLMPKWAPPLEMTCVGWLGDWRPSAILELLRSLLRSSYLSSSLADAEETDRVLSQLIRDIRIEETVIDGEMAEIQTTCILHLPFDSNSQNDASPLALVQSELKKIQQVIIKAQQLRFKALEFALKKVLSPVDAAEFLVAFAGIQDEIHQFAARQNSHKSPIRVPVKAFRTP